MIQIRSRTVGDAEPCFITFEAGATITGFESAKRLIAHAAEAKGDAVKFQLIDPDRLLSDRNQTFSYGILVDRETGETETITESVYDVMCRRVLSTDEWRALKKQADSLDLAFFLTVCFEEELELVAELKCDSIKIASADIDHLPFIREAARTGVCLQLDTGNSTLGEVETAVDIIRSEGNEKIIIHQCPSGYPAHIPSINLNMIPTLKQMFPYPIAYSDHTPGWEMDVAAVALGANLIEKTISLDRTTRSAEHMFSLEPHELAGFIETIRNVEIAMGESRRHFPPDEVERRRAGRRSIHVRRDLPEGHLLEAGDLDYCRPGTGIPAAQSETLQGRTLRVGLKAGDQLKWTDIAG